MWQTKTLQWLCFLEFSGCRAKVDPGNRLRGGMGAWRRPRWARGQDAVYTALRKQPCQLPPVLSPRSPPPRCEEGEETLIWAEQ